MVNHTPHSVVYIKDKACHACRYYVNDKPSKAIDSGITRIPYRPPWGEAVTTHLHASGDQAPPAVGPVRPGRRIEIVDILRGFSILGILLMNMLSFSGYGSTREMASVHRIAMLGIRFIAQAKFYTLFSFLFGWGMATQMARAERRGARFVPLYARRLFVLLLIGLIHAVFIWDGDILTTYALLGFPLLFFRKRSHKVLLAAVVVCMLIPILLNTPGPGEAFDEAHSRIIEPYSQAVAAGHQAGAYTQGSYWEATLLRLKTLRLTYAGAAYWATHVFGMFLLGLYAGRRRMFHNIPRHIPLLRTVMWGGLVVGVLCNLTFVCVFDSPGLVPTSCYQLATRGARTIGGPALCLFYISAIVLISRRPAWQRRLAPLAAVGRAALSNYLLQSVLCTLIFYGYGLGLYGKLGPAITLFLTLAIYRLQISLSNRWLSRHRFGPAEWLWRSLTYGKLQRMSPTTTERETGTRPEGPAEAEESQAPLSTWFAFVARRLLFIGVVAFAIAYFCVLGLRLSANSTTVGQRTLSVKDLAGPALEETIEFFEDALHGRLGYVVQGITQRTRVPLTALLADTLRTSGSLLAASIAFATVGGIVAGGLAATRRHSSLALPILTLTVVGVSIPSFFLALLLRVADIKFYQRTGLGLFPVYGISEQRTASLLPRVIAPALVLAARPLAHITRVTFASISDVLSRDFIRTAHAKGLKRHIVFWRHALRNVGVSVLTAVAVSLRFALGSLPVVEVFFSWPGLGVTMLHAIYERQVNVVTILALGLGVTFLLINLAVDLLYRLIDPRLRALGNGGST